MTVPNLAIMSYWQVITCSARGFLVLPIGMSEKRVADHVSTDANGGDVVTTPSQLMVASGGSVGLNISDRGWQYRCVTYHYLP